MTTGWWYGGIALVAALLAWLWPLPAGLLPQDAWSARVGSAVLAVLICAASARWPRVPAAVWGTVAAAAAIAAAALLLAHFDAASACVADYDGQPRIIGREYTSEIAPYIASNPGLSASDRLLDAGGVPERVWTTASIQRCRFWVSWGGVLAVPLFAACAGAIVAGMRPRQLRVGRPRTNATPPPHKRGPALEPASSRVTPQAPRYDAFVSYRHADPDRGVALEILEFLERNGFRVAIDVRDFAANEHFISEMERCIKESRFVLCVITARYVESAHTSEEAIISKTLDLAERRRRLVPLIVERVELPVWLHGLVGIDFTTSAQVDPFDRLKALVAESA